MNTSGIRYLLAIEELSLNGAVRSKDVAEKLSLTRASVCRAVDRLSRRALRRPRRKRRAGVDGKGKNHRRKIRTLYKKNKRNAHQKTELPRKRCRTGRDQRGVRVFGRKYR